MVEGWNRHEAERTEVLRGLQEERQAAELTRSKQQEVGNQDHEALEPGSPIAGQGRNQGTSQVDLQLAVASLIILLLCPLPSVFLLSDLHG